MGVLRPFSSRETARTAANHLEALSLSFSISLSLTHSRGALDYFNREITQSTQEGSVEGREKGEGVEKEEGERDRGDGEGRDVAWYVGPKDRAPETTINLFIPLALAPTILLSVSRSPLKCTRGLHFSFFLPSFFFFNLKNNFSTDGNKVDF